MSSIALKLDSLLSSLKSKGIDPSRNLKPGLSDEALKSCEAKFGFPFPPEIADLYRWRNGHADPDAEAERLLLFRDMAFLSLEHALQARAQIDLFLAMACGKPATPISQGTYLPIAGLEGHYYVVPCGDHAFSNVAARPVVSVGEGIDVHFLSIEAMLDTCNAWVTDAAYSLDTLAPNDELEAWNRINPGVLDGRAIEDPSNQDEPGSKALTIHDLYEAVARGDEVGARAVLGSGVRISDTDDFGRTLMHDSIRQGIVAARLALSLGGEINAECSKRWTPLFHLRKYEEPTEENLAVHAWAEACGAIARPDRLAEVWRVAEKPDGST